MYVTTHILCFCMQRTSEHVRTETAISQKRLDVFLISLGLRHVRHALISILLVTFLFSVYKNVYINVTFLCVFTFKKIFFLNVLRP